MSPSALPGAVTPLIPADALAERVAAMGRDIAAAMPGDVTMVALLKGGFVFAADLMRALGAAGVDARVEFIRLSSYGGGKESSGTVVLVGPMPEGLKGRRVLIVDDIADSGRTLSYVRQLMLDAGAVEVRIAALLDKPSRRVIPVPVDFIGFSVEDVFVVGYGIDYAEGYRYLPFIGVVE